MIKVKEASVCTAVYLQYTIGYMDEAINALSFPIHIEMPCGSIFKQESNLNFPRGDVRCPCGDTNHWFVRHERMEVFMNLYRIRNKSTNEWWEGEAESAAEALSKAGWPPALCEIKEKTYNGAGGWKKVDVRN